ncbi:MAG: hypothetical protein II371_04665 [Flavobacteriales bacterium]|jgi:hypothetical protein|nr:hypothetical protein [Flavobacteriales bacterium]MBR4403097.1 hypothetical protein [Flavobacteriales bacterium]
MSISIYDYLSSKQMKGKYATDVDKEKQDVMGPMDMEEYMMAIDSIGVDDEDVNLKVKLKL